MQWPGLLLNGKYIYKYSEVWFCFGFFLKYNLIVAICIKEENEAVSLLSPAKDIRLVST